MNTPNHSPLRAGAAQVDITPSDSAFLFGYPHVKRYSTGTHDPLLASAIYLESGTGRALFIGNDLIWVPRNVSLAARARIADQTGLSREQVLISATHTHSGPLTENLLSCEADPILPPTDPAYEKELEDRIVEAGISAVASARDAEIGVGTTDVSGLGTNRHDPAGPSDPQVPVVVARDVSNSKTIAVMAVCTMHPTVLHEDWTLYSGDFPGLARKYLQATCLEPDVPFVYHMGASGNQSPRHVVKGNTIEEAQRIGTILGQAIETLISTLEFKTDTLIQASSQTISSLPVRAFPSVAEAEKGLTNAAQHLQGLRDNNAPSTEIRTAECDWFGAEETRTLAKAAAAGRVEAAAAKCLPVEIQLIRIGDWSFIGWPGEVFVEFALAIKDQHPRSTVITLVNGQMQGYLVTQQAIDRRSYEAGNAVFQSPESGQAFVDATLDLLSRPGSLS